MIINAKISGQEPGRYVLSSGGAEVGWLRAGTIGFRGFADPESARRAAEVAAATLTNWYRMRWQSREPLPWGGDVPPHLRVVAGNVVVGRIIPPGVEPDSDGSSSAFALRTPRTLWVATAVGLAQRIYAAVHERGLTAGISPVSAVLHQSQPARARGGARPRELAALAAHGAGGSPPDSAA